MKNKAIIILLIFWTLFVQSCRTAKKEWVNETFAQKNEVQALQETFETSIETVKSETSETISEIRKEVSNSRSINETTSESENTTVTVDITAEDGKEKSATVGGTTITSNGANVKVTTSTSKEASKESEERFQAFESQLASERQEKEELQQYVYSLEQRILDIEQTMQSTKSWYKKTVKILGATLPVWILLIIILAVVGIVWYFKKSIPFLK